MRICAGVALEAVRSASPRDTVSLQGGSHRGHGWFGGYGCGRVGCISQAIAGAGDGQGEQPVEQASRYSPMSGEPAAPLQGGISSLAGLQRHRAAARFPQRQQPHSIVNTILVQSLPNRRAAKHRRVASRRIVIRSRPSVRSSRTAVAMMPGRVSAGLAGRSRRLRGISERGVMPANLANPGRAGDDDGATGHVRQIRGGPLGVRHGDLLLRLGTARSARHRGWAGQGRN